jgi:D-3-phosphoglycerate dehydrogenase / 2-oxoglutarate reductase
VTCHVPDTPLTRGLLGAAQLDRMKKGAHLVNTSRGTVVDLDALAARLRTGAIGGAAIDVFPREPSGNDVVFESPLRGIENVILTPHVAGSTVEAQENIGAEVARKLSNFARCGNTTGSVNFPQLSLTDAVTPSRILHVHANMPGVVRRINDLVADEGLNIAGQHLQTLGEIGYVVLDVEGPVSPGLMESIGKVQGTIRARLVHA